ncbi:MAG: UDP-N-acetylglucosamine 2-epimerase (non-hydrolyzing) [Flavobacteriaceae bacterium]|nr:UDP-N-acetylglucosamine 2-epimerase (non-hydrolyzing) [Flavobacteriaceae bacterium]|tara:strand:- start:965 stop:2089 length:1125 start_codon:yes stop_codon:yes gene_type:complete
MNKYSVLFLIGTRPEAIKLAPVILAFKKSNLFSVKIVLSGQHDEMIRPVMDFFNLKEDANFNIIKTTNTLEEITSKILKDLNIYIGKVKPNMVFVQGDTNTAFSGALSAFFNKVPIAHVEAGLRTNNIYSPFPEEANRRMISQIATLHFPPTKTSYNNLLKSGINKNIYISGNTVVDALSLVPNIKNKKIINGIDINTDKYILTTIHRRENWGAPIENIAKGILNFLDKNKNVKLILPLHKNPLVRKPIRKILGHYENIFLVETIPYIDFILILKNALIILTDSGGVQEEAVTLGKPLLILRDCTERPEVFEGGNASLVGTDPDKIEKELSSLIKDNKRYQIMSQKSKAFGDGDSSKVIFEKTLSFLEENLNLL